MSEYKKHIEKLSREELIELIVGDDSKPPLLTRNEPTYSRPQILWGFNKFMKEDNLIQQDFGEAEQVVYQVLNNIEGLMWTSFYNYDYLRFDIKKPSFWIIVFMSASTMVLWFWVIIKSIINLIEWI